jgi:acyl dehydratase
MNTNQIHFNNELAERGLYGKPLVNSGFTVALVAGLTVPDTSENAAANLGWTDITLPNPVFVGDTLWAESEILDKRESSSRPSVGIVTMRSRGINQRHEVVIQYKRTFMVYKRDAPEMQSTFPGTEQPWSVS